MPMAATDICCCLCLDRRPCETKSNKAGALFSYLALCAPGSSESLWIRSNADLTWDVFTVLWVCEESEMVKRKKKMLQAGKVLFQLQGCCKNCFLFSGVSLAWEWAIYVYSVFVEVTVSLWRQPSLFTCQLSTGGLVLILLLFLKKFIYWRLITFNKHSSIVMVFAIHQYESAIGIHVSPPSWIPLILRVVTEHLLFWVRCIIHQTGSG